MTVGAQVDLMQRRATESKCRLCYVKLGSEEEDDLDLRVCGSCKVRPEARRLGLGASAPGGTGIPRWGSAREFTEAERALIKSVGGLMPAARLLSLLNERLWCDLGPDAPGYTLEQLQAALGDSIAMAPASDWASMRKLLSQARRSGVLDLVDEQVIDDFAVVYSLNAKQVLVLKETLLAKDGACFGRQG